MEKERKSLFGRLLDFWKERFGDMEEDGIGFQREKEVVENHFVESGAADARRGRERDFPMEMAEKKQKLFFSEHEEKHQNGKETGLFAETAKVFREEATEERENRDKLIFLQDEPMTEKEDRKTVPFLMEAEQKTEAAKAEEQQTEKVHLWKEPQKEAEVDVEKLMRQITKKLWEEREGCGRRLR